ncbi:MAG: transcriptional regulator [Oceanospirillum sp.]|nr:transcriptional regulator [Oceanospirillum sp.]
MSEHTDVQIIKQNGKPMFAVVPYDQWIELTQPADEDVYIPHEVVKYQVKENLSLMAAWRKYLKLSQTELANRMGISQSAIAQMESSPETLQKKTLAKVAKAMQIQIEQLED